jgi:hypothetical protein
MNVEEPGHCGASLHNCMNDRAEVFWCKKPTTIFIAIYASLQRNTSIAQST